MAWYPEELVNCKMLIQKYNCFYAYKEQFNSVMQMKKS